ARALDLESGDGGAGPLPRRLDRDRDRAPDDDADGNPRRRLPWAPRPSSTALVSGAFSDRAEETACLLASWLVPTGPRPPGRRSARPSTSPNWRGGHPTTSAAHPPPPGARAKNQQATPPP